MADFFVCAIIYRTSPASGDVEFLVIDTRKIYRVSGSNQFFSSIRTKFPGGKQKHPGETVVEALCREVWEETNLALRPSAVEEIWKQEVSSVHTQYAFMVDFDNCAGELRTTHIIDGDEILLPPRWTLARVLGRSLFFSHQSPYLAACKKLHLI